MFSVEILLDGKTETLEPTFGAAERINNAFGNFVVAANNLGNYDFSSYVAVVAAALNKKPDDVKPHVFAAGMVQLVDPLQKYVHSLMCGGQDPDEYVKQREADAAQGKP